MNYVVYCIFYLVRPAFQLDCFHLPALFYWQISLGIQCGCYKGTIKISEFYLYNVSAAIFMYYLVTDEHYLPAFLEEQIWVLCAGDVKRIKHMSS